MSNMLFPKIVAVKEIFQSPWVNLIEKKVEYEERTELYYSLFMSDYVTAVVKTEDGRFILVRQYRPAVEDFTLELPAGTVNKGESPTEACAREILEETGHEIKTLRFVGSYYPDTGRFGNKQHVFDACVSDNPITAVEPGITLEYFSFDEICNLIRSGEFIHQLHISALLLVKNGF